MKKYPLYGLALEAFVSAAVESLSNALRVYPEQTAGINGLQTTVLLAQVWLVGLYSAGRRKFFPFEFV